MYPGGQHIFQPFAALWICGLGERQWLGPERTHGACGVARRELSAALHRRSARCRTVHDRTCAGRELLVELTEY